MGSDFKHISVLLQKAVDFLEIKKDKWYVDATAGGGGHIQEIRERGGRVLAIDQDEDAIHHLVDRFKSDRDVIVIQANFSEITKICRDQSIVPMGVLFDLGVSSYQIDDSGRGFSFLREEELDMRMDKDGKLSAQKIINTYSYEQLQEIFAKYGEEPHAEEIADAILRARRIRPITTTNDLVDIVKSVSNERRIHPATRVFQALRIEANSELESLEHGLVDAFENLDSSGRIVVISFHSLEDRIVKRYMERMIHEGKGKQITKKPITADWKEIKQNIRSRSAKMRVLEKI